MLKCSLSMILLILFLLFVVKINAQRPKIIGGKDASKYRAWQISMHRRTSKGLYYHSCGGCIISRYYVLTAAHCVEDNNPTALSVVAGIINIADPNGDRHTVEKCIVHERYNRTFVINDIAVVKVHDEFVFNDKIQLISYTCEYIEPGYIAQLTGWGQTLPAPKSPTSNTLQELDTEIISNDICNELNNGNIIDSQICTKVKPQEGPCFGDSGGPLVKKNGECVIGIVSYVLDRCAGQYPNVFTRVSAYNSWINEKINNDK